MIGSRLCTDTDRELYGNGESITTPITTALDIVRRSGRNDGSSEKSRMVDVL